MHAINDLAALGTSTWLDDLSRDRIESGNLATLIDTKSIVGVTTNPAIFAAAMTGGSAYDEQISTCRAVGMTVEEAVYSMAISDVRRACDVFAEVYKKSGGADGRVSIEVDPRISEDTQATIEQARQLWSTIDRPNLLIKIPATPGSLPAITEVISEGISVNVTLIFSVECYRKVVRAYLDGINRAIELGRDVSDTYSVASVFVSRLDTEVDKRLEAIGSKQALALRGKAGIANARLAYAEYQRFFGDDAALDEKINPQRLLWASTGVKNPDYPADMYVTELAGPNTVNTMPESTIDAAIKGQGCKADTLTGTADQAAKTWQELQQVGIDFDDVFATLEKEGVDKFVDSWNGLLQSISERLA